MESLDRASLMRKTMPALRTIIRSLGADSPLTETKDSLIHRILLFAPQKFKEQAKIERKPLEPVKPDELTVRLLPLLNDGLMLTCEEQNWFITYEGRQDSGNMSMPIEAIERCAKYLMRKAV